jgi:mRNA interferase MazF
MRKGEVWWVDFDPSIGGEIQKMRPAVVVSNDVANARLNRVQVVPLTTNVERVFPGEAIVRFRDEARKAMANQIMTAAKQRFGRRIGDLNRAGWSGSKVRYWCNLVSIIGPNRGADSLICVVLIVRRSAPDRS